MESLSRSLVKRGHHGARVSASVRHLMLTFLTAKRLSDVQIQLICGRGTKKSRKVYQHLSLESVKTPLRTWCSQLWSDLDTSFR